ncbi:hypothetical protein O3P69_015105 [Scylla paramamosain]|uniref:Uncharacterized protein n=1 Tax=Scylla paramamosain TaxID=85552 RepID=A0AAW0T629_SCYPA
MDQLDTIMATHLCQNVIIVGNLNQHLVSRAFTELTAVHGLTDQINFVSHVRGASLHPVLTASRSDHLAVLCEVGFNPACEEKYRVGHAWSASQLDATRPSTACRAMASVAACVSKRRECFPAFPVDPPPAGVNGISRRLSAVTSVPSAPFPHRPLHRWQRGRIGQHASPLGRRTPTFAVRGAPNTDKHDFFQVRM